MTCILCGKAALFAVGKKGYCKDHKAEASVATARSTSLSTGTSFRGNAGITCGIDRTSTFVERRK